MKLKLNDKKEIVAEVAGFASNAVSVVAADYCGLTASEMAQLRASAREEKVNLRIVRNTLARIALIGTEYEGLSKALSGPILLGFSNDEPGSTARLMRDFAKDHKNLDVKAISISGKLYDKSHLDSIAKLPNRIEAITRLASVLQAPVTKLVRTMSEVPSKLVRALAAVRDTKQ